MFDSVHLNHVCLDGGGIFGMADVFNEDRSAVHDFYRDLIELVNAGNHPVTADTEIDLPDLRIARRNHGVAMAESIDHFHRRDAVA